MKLFYLPKWLVVWRGFHEDLDFTWWLSWITLHGPVYWFKWKQFKYFWVHPNVDRVGNLSNSVCLSLFSLDEQEHKNMALLQHWHCGRSIAVQGGRKLHAFDVVGFGHICTRKWRVQNLQHFLFFEKSQIKSWFPYSINQNCQMRKYYYN